MKLHPYNDTPATPLSIVETWGTEKQVSTFIEDIWPVNWTKEVFNNYVRNSDKDGELLRAYDRDDLLKEESA